MSLLMIINQAVSVFHGGIEPPVDARLRLVGGVFFRIRPEYRAGAETAGSFLIVFVQADPDPGGEGGPLDRY